jgi:mRNA-degrading endonuclease toxin of MazEF toxin-antitoxin module
MKPFEIYSWQAPGWAEPHPCVVVSHPARAERKPDVDVVLCASQRAARDPEPHEVLLDEADGLDWPTLCKCDLIYTVPKVQITPHKRGEVTETRQTHLLRTIIGAHGWGERLARG